MPGPLNLPPPMTPDEMREFAGRALDDRLDRMRRVPKNETGSFTLRAGARHDFGSGDCVTICGVVRYILGKTIHPDGTILVKFGPPPVSLAPTGWPSRPHVNGKMAPPGLPWVGKKGKRK